MAFVQHRVQQAPGSCSISKALFKFIDCHSFVALTNLDTVRCDPCCRLRKHDSVMISHLVVHTSLFIMTEFASCVLQTKIRSLFQHVFLLQVCQPPPLRKRNIWSHTPEPVERENAIPSWANRWRWLTPPPRPPISLSELGHYKKKKISDNVGGRECQKGKEKRTKVCWCVKADKVRSSVATFPYLMADLSKCIGSLLGSVAVRLWRNCTKILPSIRSVLIRLARPSASSCIWISGRTGAGVAHVPGLLRVPSAACQYAWDNVDQCLLNHFPNRGNDNYKKWRLCTLCKCCAMTLEPNGPSY